MDKIGLLALVGGSEWTEGCTFDSGLLAASGGSDVLVLPTAAAYQHPERVVLGAAEWFEPLGGQVEGLMVLDRASAERPRYGGRRPRRPLHLHRRGIAAASQVRAQELRHLRGAPGSLVRRGRRGRLGRRCHGAHRPDGRPAWRCADRGTGPGRPAGRRPALRRRDRRRPRPEAGAHRGAGPGRRCPWSGSRSARRCPRQRRDVASRGGRTTGRLPRRSPHRTEALQR